MPQSHSTHNILGATPYRNPRHQAEAAALDEHDKSLQTPSAQGEGTTDSEVKPEHNWEKRYKDLQSYSAKKIHSLESEIRSLQQQGVPRLEAPKTQEELEAFKGKNPEMFAVIQSMANSLFQSHIAQYDQKIAEMQGSLQETAQEKAVLALRQAHPDYEAIQASDDFHNWAATQSTEVQDWIYNNPNNAQLAIQAISLFKYHSGWGKEKQATTNVNQGGDYAVSTRTTTQVQGAVDRNHPAYVWTESEISRMRPEEFHKWDQHITLAQREGRIALGR
jgi:hypothetical protein